MLQAAPPGLDHRIGEGDLDLGQDATERASFEEGVDLAVDVLDAGVRVHLGDDEARVSLTEGLDLLGGIGEHGAGVRGIQLRRDRPCEDPSRVVVDHGVQVRLRAIEQPEQRDVDVHEYAGSRGSDADGGSSGVHSEAGAVPAVFPDEACPRGDVSKHLPDALGVEGQGAQRHVTVVGAGDELSHGRALLGGEPRRATLRTRRAVVEVAGERAVAPGLIAAGRETQKPEGHGKPSGMRDTVDGAEDRQLLGAIGQALPIEAKVEDAHQRCEEPHHSAEPVQLVLDASEPRLRLGEAEREGTGPAIVAVVDGHHLPHPTPEPAPRRALGHAEAPRKHKVAGGADELADAVVVGVAHGDSPVSLPLGGGEGREPSGYTAAFSTFAPPDALTMGRRSSPC